MLEEGVTSSSLTPGQILLVFISKIAILCRHPYKPTGVSLRLTSRRRVTVALCKSPPPPRPKTMQNVGAAASVCPGKGSR
jgi:hypothetical protein